MSQQTIGIGSAANDGTGDALRTAFDKCNQNFTELFTRTGVSVNRIDSNVYQTPLTLNATTTGAAVTANNLVAYPFEVRRAMTVNKLGFNVTTLAAGNARVGIYRDNGSGQPGVLVADTGSLSTGTTGQKENSTALAAAVTPGLHWLVFVADAAPQLSQYTAANTISVLGMTSALTRITGLFRSFTYAALPSDESSATYSLNTSAMIQLWART